MQWKQQGFSLVEAMVAVAIISIMTMAGVPQYIAYKRARSMKLAKEQMVNEVRFVQDNTLSGIKFPGTTIPARGGYGLRFNAGTPSSYIVFGDRDANHRYDAAGGEWLETVQLPAGITITGLSIQSAGIADYVCAPPYGKGTINAASGELVVTLRNSDGTTSTVSLSTTGKVSQ
jgi:prepilin-type N-terminal cleavage/methylation domain-containing protein